MVSDPMPAPPLCDVASVRMEAIFSQVLAQVDEVIRYISRPSCVIFLYKPHATSKLTMVH